MCVAVRLLQCECWSVCVGMCVVVSVRVVVLERVCRNVCAAHWEMELRMYVYIGLFYM